MKVKIYDQIINDIMDDIHYGNLKPGEKLPTYAELAKKYNTSIVTVRKSISSLINKGYLSAVERVGTFVRECEKEQYLISFAPQANINEEITEISVEDISLSLIKMREIRQEMKAVEMRQILYSDTLPICYIITALLLNGRYNPESMADMTEKNLQTINKILDGFEIKKVLEITMDTPNRFIQNKLLVDRDDPVFCFTTYYYTMKDEPVGKSVLYVAGENIDLYGKSFLK